MCRNVKSCHLITKVINCYKSKVFSQKIIWNHICNMWNNSLLIVLDIKQRKIKHEKYKRIFFQALQSIFHNIITQFGKNPNISWLQNIFRPVQVRICEKIPSFEHQLSNIWKILHRNTLIHNIKTKISSSHSKLFFQGCVISNEYSWWTYFQRYAKSLHQ